MKPELNLLFGEMLDLLFGPGLLRGLSPIFNLYELKKLNYNLPLL